ncbi:unnamed protein product [Dracunculus medinensis]|uniref:EGF-like domain-containing protein n=1 Tax=Dracunculus medinensis TaxID=318479 RepID=A0A0N4UCP5_DRAME|nr:unnamed protein product [Dracunculus medinensis]
MKGEFFHLSGKFRRTSDCGKLQVTGEVIHSKMYRINATFIAERDPIRNANVDATSTVFAVIQIGLKGGIFQYTNALKILGKPHQILNFEEAFFCYRGSTLVDQDKCMLCERGSYHNLLSNKCEPCARGKFQPKSGRVSCLKCYEGFTTVMSGSISKNDCIHDCPRGHYLNNASSKCKPCGFFAYQPTNGMTSCIPCPAGTVSYTNSATSVEQCLENCPAGHDYSSDATCMPCNRGFYKPSTDLICKPCKASTTTEGFGSTSENSCILTRCRPGYYLNQDFGQCLRCGHGYYQDESGSRNCKKCPLGTTTRMFGAKSIENCKSTNQCATGEHKCHWLAACFDLPDIDNIPSYSCKCQPGFIGNGFECTDICFNLCLNGARCKKNSRGQPKCICLNGYEGFRCAFRRSNGINLDDRI